MPDGKQEIPQDDQNDGSDIPASIIFMEMMRQVAAERTPPPAAAEGTPPPAKPADKRASQEVRRATGEIPAAPAPRRATQERAAVPPPSEPLPAAPLLNMPPPLPVGESLAPHAPPAETLIPAAASAEPVTSEALPNRPLTEDERRQMAAMEAQRVRRIKRRQEKRRRHTVSVLGGVVRSFLLIIPSAILMATIFSWWTNPEFLREETRQDIQSALVNTLPTQLPTIVPTPNYLRRIGIVSGHRGRGQENPYDPGAVCPDGLTENEINFAVATRVVVELRSRGYSVELLEEFDPRLNEYEAEALVSIHANDCTDYGAGGTGYLVSNSAARGERMPDAVLRECLAEHYQAATNLTRHQGLTRDMTDYHIFREISIETPGVIIELGFMNRDRDLLTQRPDLLAQGIVGGILCFIEPETQLTVTPPQVPTVPIATPTPGL